MAHSAVSEIDRKALQAVLQEHIASGDVDGLEEELSKSPDVYPETLTFLANSKIPSGLAGRMLYMMLKKKPLINQPTSNGHVLLRRLGQGKDPFCLHLALRAGANPDFADLHGDTPLHGAGYTLRLENIKTLLDAGADLSIENDKGQDVYDAMRKGALGAVFGKKQRQERQQKIETLIRHYALLPSLPEDVSTLEKDDLFLDAERGKSFMDTPQIWHHIDAVLEVLEAKGQGFTKAELLQTNAQGETWLQRAAECGAFEKVLRYLDARGEKLEVEDLLTAEQEPTPLLKTLEDTASVAVLFEERHCKHLGSAVIRRCHKALTADRGKLLVPNVHGL
ncbi:MAG: hypothetical protein ACPG80_06080, partial [Rickettsiales bacterium]